MFAADTDGTAPNNEIIYRIESEARDKFRIDGQTGRITVESGANLDHDIYGAQYRLHVLGIDRGTPSLTGSTTVTVTITDTNNKDPVFNPTSASVSIPENTVVGEEVYTYTATDADRDALLSYSLSYHIFSYLLYIWAFFFFYISFHFTISGSFRHLCQQWFCVRQGRTQQGDCGRNYSGGHG